MRVDHGIITFELERCWNCLQGHPGKVAGRQPCPACKGTGNGKRGGPRGCKECSGFGTAPDFENLLECGSCEGTGKQMETETSTIPAEIVRTLPVLVVRENRGSTWLEEYLPVGCLFSSIDYGRTWAMEDEAVIATAREAMNYTQACKVASGGVLCDRLCILLHRQGYSVRAVFDK